MFLTGGYDYVSGPYFIIIPTNMTTAVFNLNLTDDDVYESIETFELVLNTTSLPDRVYHDHPYTATVSILDDEKCT